MRKTSNVVMSLRKLKINKIRILIGMAAIVTFVVGLVALYRHFRPSDGREVYVDSVSSIREFQVKIFREAEPQKGLLIYLGDKALGKLNVEYAKELAALSYYVAVVDSDEFSVNAKIDNSDERNHCLNVSEQLNRLNDQLRVQYKLNAEERSVLVGNGVGASFVYAALAQQETTKFYAGVSINFLPTIKSSSLLCGINNLQIAGNRLLPTKNIHTSWYVFQSGAAAQNQIADAFISGVASAKVTVSDGPITEPNSEALQILQWLDPRLTDQLTSSSGDSDLPVVEVEATAAGGALKVTDTFTVMLTGDGGWAEIDKNLAAHLAEQGIPTVALDSLAYFWRKRTPDETAIAVDDLISHYGEKWNKQKVILLGFSFGAEVLPFVANRLSDENKTRVALVALLSIGRTASFEFHLSNWIDSDASIDRHEVLPELKKMNWTESVCIYGEEDDDNGCFGARDTTVKLIPMSGDHHFDGHYELLAEHIINSLNY